MEDCLELLKREASLLRVSVPLPLQKSFLHTPTLLEKCPLRSFSVPYFPAFELNTERYSVSLRIQSKCGEMRNLKNSEYEHFSRSADIREIKFIRKFSWYRYCISRPLLKWCKWFAILFLLGFCEQKSNHQFSKHLLQEKNI